MKNFKEELTNVKAFAFDVDGVFTNSNLYLHPSGELLRAMNVKDGYAVQIAVNKQFPIAIISGGKGESTRKRFSDLGITDIYLGTHDKLDNFKDFCAKYSLNPENILYMGDDIPDFEVMKNVGIPTCPANAAAEIKAISIYISDYNGGEGCVRDVVEQVLRAQGLWQICK